MRQYDSENLVVRAGNASEKDVLVEVRPDQAGWETLWFQARRLLAGMNWRFDTGEQELALVVLGGCLDVESSRGAWTGIGGRQGVFAGLPHALYLPRRTRFSVTAAEASEFAVAATPVDCDYPPRLITPCEIPVEIRGGDNATRQINGIMLPGFACGRLVVVEVYTPGGNWSSYPPHKHDIHMTDENGSLVEADLDEIYYYRLNPPGGFALQRIYTGPDSPLHRAGFPVDAVVAARDGDVVLVPEGYHPVSSPYGYTTYYLNVLAGSAQSLACTDDPQHAWVKETYRKKDPRVPLYDVTEARRP